MSLVTHSLRSHALCLHVFNECYELPCCSRLQGLAEDSPLSRAGSLSPCSSVGGSASAETLWRVDKGDASAPARVAKDNLIRLLMGPVSADSCITADGVRERFVTGGWRTGTGR